MKRQGARKIGIVNTGLGNIGAIESILKKAGANAFVCSEPGMISDMDALILPGVGAFDKGMQNLQAKSWPDVLNEMVLIRKIPVLGICLGMHLMCNKSEEGTLNGLGWINAEVKKILIPEYSGLKIPHMGWNTIRVTKPNPLLPFDDEELRFYFTHSYHVDCIDSNDVIAITRHGGWITAAIERQHIFGVQFHPEKSHRFGLALMRRFIEIIC